MNLRLEPSVNVECIIEPIRYLKGFKTFFFQVIVAAGEYTTGSAWLNEEKLLEQARDMWKRLSDEQKGAYGEDYFEQALRSLEKYTQNAVS